MYFPTLCKWGLAWGRTGVSSHMLVEPGGQGLEREVTFFMLTFQLSFGEASLDCVVPFLSDRQPRNGVDQGCTAIVLPGRKHSHQPMRRDHLEMHAPEVAHGKGSSVARTLDFSREVRNLDFHVELSRFLQAEKLLHDFLKLSCTAN